MKTDQLLQLHSLITIICIAILAPDMTLACRPGINQIKSAIENGKIAFVGEASHRRKEPHYFLQKVIDATDARALNFIGLEVGSDKQSQIDFYSDNPARYDHPKIKILMAESDKHSFAKVFAAINKKNREREKLNLPKIKMIALDKPIPNFTSSNDFTQWILARDQFMMMRLQKYADLHQSGILYLGAAHLAKDTVLFPKIFDISKYLSPLGNLVVKKIGEANVISVWLQPVLIEKDLPMIPKSWAPLYSLRKNLTKKYKNRCLFSTKERSFKVVEKEAKADLVPGFQISKLFDYLISVESINPD